MKDYSMYLYYNGEEENPFDYKNQNAACMFWFYESMFDTLFYQYQTSDWYEFFGNNGKEFLLLLSEEDYIRPTESKKASIFTLWRDGYLYK